MCVALSLISHWQLFSSFWIAVESLTVVQWKLRGIKPKYSIHWFFPKNLKNWIPKITILPLNQNQMLDFHCVFACAPHKWPKWSPSPSKPKKGVSKWTPQTSLRLKWQQPWKIHFNFFSTQWKSRIGAFFMMFLSLYHMSKLESFLESCPQKKITRSWLLTKSSWLRLLTRNAALSVCSSVDSVHFLGFRFFLKSKSGWNFC